jgi:two-component system sensor histidine kinase/response regulator
LKLVHSSALSLLTIINDILDFSKIEAGKLELESIEMSLSEMLGDTLKALALRAHEKGLELISDIHPDVPDKLVGDPVRLRQVGAAALCTFLSCSWLSCSPASLLFSSRGFAQLSCAVTNLIGNAIKFTSIGEIVLSVTVDSITRTECMLHFAVRDTGIGISPSNLTVIFEAFSQADGSITRKYGGTGLGLTISTRLVELMKGRLTAEVGKTIICCAIAHSSM